MPCAVMCCGCGKGLNRDGKTTSEVIMSPGGVGELSGIMHLVFPMDLAYFPEPKDADKAASEAGWQVADSKGPNHRCPSCKGNTGSKRRGAYIYRP